MQQLISQSFRHGVVQIVIISMQVVDKFHSAPSSLSSVSLSGASFTVESAALSSVSLGCSCPDCCWTCSTGGGGGASLSFSFSSSDDDDEDDDDDDEDDTL